MDGKQRSIGFQPHQRIEGEDEFENEDDLVAATLH